jgi:hypothetical protein
MRIPSTVNVARVQWEPSTQDVLQVVGAMLDASANQHH